MTRSEIVEAMARSIAAKQNFAWGLNYDTALQEDRDHLHEIAEAALAAAERAGVRMPSNDEEFPDLGVLYP